MKHSLPFLLTAILAGTAFAGPKDTKEPKRNFTISKETTYVLGPLDKDGRIDYGAALSERMGKGVTAETNANVMIWKALGPKPEGGKGQPAEFFKLMGMDEPPEKGDYFIDLRRFAREHLTVEDHERLEEIDAQCMKAGRKSWAAKEFPHIADWLKKNEKPLALFVEGMNRPHYFSPSVPRKDEKGSPGLIAALMPSVQKCRSVTYALACRAMLKLHEGKPDAAWDDLMACHRLARHLPRGGTLIDALFGFAIDGITMTSRNSFLERPDVDSTKLLGYIRDLQRMPSMATVASCLEGAERFFFLDMVMTFDRKGQNLLAWFDSDLPDKLAIPEGPLVDMNWDPALRSPNSMFDRMSSALKQTDRSQREKEVDRIEEELSALRKSLNQSGNLRKALSGIGVTPEERGKIIGDWIISSTLPAARKIQISSDRNEQSHRNQQVAFTVAAYQRDHKKYPKSLADLQPKYLAKIPNDLFSGKEIIYKPTAGGFLIYSVGPNGIDDEGRFYNDEPRGDDPNVRVPAKK